MAKAHRTDVLKLAHHRVIARALRDNPSLIDEARQVVFRWKLSTPRATYVDEWERLLDRPVAEVRREITRRTPEAARLRSSSPFALAATRVIDDEGLDRLRRMSFRLASAR